MLHCRTVSSSIWRSIIYNSKIPFAQYWHLLAKYLRTQTLKVCLLAALLFGTIGLQLINPQIIRAFIDTAFSGGTTAQLARAALIFFGLALLNQLVSVGAGYLSEDVGWRATNELRADLAEHCLRLKMAFHNRHTPGEMIERIDGDVQVMANFFSQLVLRIIGSLLLIGGVLIALFFEDWRVGGSLTIFVLVILIYMRYITPMIVPLSEKIQQANANLTSFLEERLSATEDIGANGLQAYTIRRIYPLYHHKWHLQRRLSVLWVLLHGTFTTASTLFSAVGLGLGAYLYFQDQATLGTVYLFYHYTALLFFPLHQMFEQGRDLQRATASMNRVEALFSETGIDQPVTDDPPARPRSNGPELQFSDVSFAYVPDQPILPRLSFRLEPGQSLGLLGRTGSGKTTIARLLLGLYQPTSGQILLDEQDIARLNPGDLRAQVGMVTQEVQLFRGTVRDNLTFFDPAITDAQIWTALDVLDLAGWAERLPDRLGTVLGGGRGLSAGEAQLLAFARVFLREPGLVILDEASSRLDPATEQHIEQAITTLLTDRTAIIIAHRLSTLKRVDQVMILADGQILEYGPRAVLAQNVDSHLYRLLQTELEMELV